MVLPSFLSPNVPSAKLVLTSAHIACLSERSSALAKRLFRRFANSHARVAEQQFRAAYSILPAGAFAKNLFIFHFFKVTFGGRNAAELLSPVACAPNYYLPSPVADKDFLTLAAFG